MNTQEFKTQIDSASRILVILPYILNSDSIATAGLLYRLLKNKHGKDVDIAYSGKVPERFADLLKKSEIDHDKILSEIKPVSYVIKVDDAKEAINVEWKKVGEEIDVILTPQTQEIDFSKVRFAKEGGIYDLIITINAQKLDDLGKIYSDQKKILEKFQIISINKFESTDSYATVNLANEDYSTTSEVLFKAFEDLDYTPESLDAEITAEGVIGSTFGLHQVSKPKTFGIVSELANKYDVNFAEITTKYFYSYSKDDVRLRERILKNVRFDDSRKTVYSTLSSADFSSLGISPKLLEGSDYLPFNVCKDYEYAFLVYEDGNKSYAMIHSNRVENRMSQILEAVNGHGDKLFGLATFETNSIDAANRILSAISQDSNTTSAPVVQAEPKPDTSAPVVEEKNNEIPKEPVEILQPTAEQLQNVQEVPQNVSSEENVNNQEKHEEPFGFGKVVDAQEEAPSNSPEASKSPFTPATSFTVDEKAEPAKKSNYYSANDKPFDKVTY